MVIESDGEGLAKAEETVRLGIGLGKVGLRTVIQNHCLIGVPTFEFGNLSELENWTRGVGSDGMVEWWKKCEKSLHELLHRLK